MAPGPDRAAYEAAQSELLRSLISGDGFPDGFQRDKAAAASRSLWRKRMRSVQTAWPALTVALGEDFETRFEAYARKVAPPAQGEGLTDGLTFARTLARSELTDAARVELLLARAVVKGPPFRERRAFAGAVSLRHPRRILVVVRAPPAGRRKFVLKLAR